MKKRGIYPSFFHTILQNRLSTIYLFMLSLKFKGGIWMNVYDKYGIYRSLEPKNTLPRASWKIDNNMEIRNDEIQIDIKFISINEVGFNQIYDECNGNKEEIGRIILDIINQRGKLHNPVTGTGGAIFGIVSKIGKNYPNECQVEIGDAVMSYSSVTLIPMKIDKITEIDTYTGQIKVIGKAVLYSHYPIIKKPKDLSLKIVFSVIDHAGTAAESERIVNSGDNVIIMGAGGKIGLICAFAVREKMNSNGKLYGIVNTQERKDELVPWKLFDEIIVLEVTDMGQITNMNQSLLESFDKVINCINYPNSEFLSIALCKEKGVVYFSTLGANTPLASLTAEGVGKDIDIVAYKGIVKRHADYFLDMMRRNPALIKMLTAKFNKYSHSNNPDELVLDDEGSILISKKRDPNKTKIFVNSEEFIFNSTKINIALNRALKVANYDSNVLIYGDSGSGKEIFAKLIHNHSTRVIFPFVKINCASIPDSLLESELFGYEKGAFTGADPRGKIGYWEKANNGTLFLDEIGEIPLSIQAKFLRAIQENEIYRIGSAQAIKTNVRILSATNRNLKEMVKEGSFREDLYYRLNVYPISVPKLKERKEDIIPLIKLFTKKYNEKFNIAKIFDVSALNYMENMEWEGNIRELQNFVQRIMIESDNVLIYRGDIQKMLDNTIDTNSYNNKIASGFNKGLSIQELINTENCEYISFENTVEEVERYILTLYKQKYQSTRKIAEALQITQNKTVRLLKKYNIQP